MIVIEAKVMKDIEQSAVDSGIQLEQLMEKAGTKVAELAAKIIAEKKIRKVCVICGSGNNGGDGFVIARMLSVMCSVNVILASGEPKTSLARMNFELIPQSAEILYYQSRLYECIGIIKESEMIIDAMYGIGFRDGLSPDAADLISFCNENKSAVKIAVDIPSGAICDTGAVPNGCFEADYTLSFTALKPAHVLYPSADFCGEVVVEDVGIPFRMLQHAPSVMKTTDQYIAENPLPVGKDSDHKGSKGTLLSFCGSFGMAGAAMLSGEAALRSGLGLLKIAIPESVYPIAAARLSEPVFIPLRQNENGIVNGEEYEKIFKGMSEADASLIGCGLGMNDIISDIVVKLIENASKPVVLDADGINAVSGNIDVLKRSAAPIIITPHPGEMARLMGTDARTVQGGRYHVAKSFAEEYGVTVVLKGANTIIATPQGRVYVNRTGNDGMATGGSGDMLAGMMASFLAQGMDTEAAAVNAVYYHGIAGDRCAEKYNKRSMLPSDMIAELKHIF